MDKRTKIYIITGGSFVIVAIILSIYFKIDTKFCLRVLLAIGASAFMVALPGVMEFNLNKIIHASGVFAVFCTIIFFDYITKPKRNDIIGPIEFCDVTGNIELINADNTPIDPPYSDIDFIIKPPITDQNNGTMSIKNVPIDTTDKVTPVVLKIMKRGFFTREITIGEKLSINKGKFNIIRDGRVFTINPEGSISLKKDTSDSYWKKETPAYNTQSATVATKDTIKT